MRPTSAGGSTLPATTCVSVDQLPLNPIGLWCRALMVYSKLSCTGAKNVVAASPHLHLHPLGVRASAVLDLRNTAMNERIYRQCPRNQNAAQDGAVTGLCEYPVPLLV